MFHKTFQPFLNLGDKLHFMRSSSHKSNNPFADIDSNARVDDANLARLIPVWRNRQWECGTTPANSILTSNGELDANKVQWKVVSNKVSKGQVYQTAYGSELPQLLTCLRETDLTVPYVISSCMQEVPSITRPGKSSNLRRWHQSCAELPAPAEILH